MAEHRRCNYPVHPCSCDELFAPYVAAVKAEKAMREQAEAELKFAQAELADLKARVSGSVAKRVVTK